MLKNTPQQHYLPLYCHPLNQLQTQLLHWFAGITGGGIRRERPKRHFMSMIMLWGRDLFRRGCLFLVGGVTPTASLTPLVQVGTARSEGAAITGSAVLTARSSCPYLCRNCRLEVHEGQQLATLPIKVITPDDKPTNRADLSKEDLTLAAALISHQQGVSA